MVDVSAKGSTTRSATAVGVVRFSSSAVLPLIKSASLKKGDVLAVARVAGIMAAKKTAQIVPLCHSGITIEGVKCHVELVPGNMQSIGERPHEMRSPAERGSNGEAKESKEDMEGKEINTDSTKSQINSGDQTATPSLVTRLDRYLSKPVGDCGGIRIAATVTCSGKTGVEMEALCSVAGAGLSILDMVKGADRGAVLCAIRNIAKSGGRSGTWIAEDWGSQEKL